MAIIVLEQGCLVLENASERIPLEAEEIFSAIFEDGSSVQGIPIARSDFEDTRLEFIKNVADPVVTLEPGPPEQPNAVVCRLMAKGIGFMAPVSDWSGRLLDYAIDGHSWMPLPQGALYAAGEFLRQVGLSRFGSISLAEYLRIQRIDATAINIEDRTGEVFSSQHLSSFLSRDVPAGFVGTLYPYQAMGYNWLAYMRRSGLGCIIADEMGLGKTIQVICLLLDAALQEGTPCLVITPATILENWRREINRFAPTLTICLHRGVRRTGFPDELRRYNVVITSYDTAVADISLLRNLTWNVLVIDEAQAIKNPDAKRTLRLKSLSRNCGVAMTGTPVENHLVDLWSITDFAVPSLLGLRDEFERNHPDSIAGASSLEPILSPIILRRRVADVAQDLPERIDIPQPLELDSESAEVYELLRHAAEANPTASLASLVKLRMFCTHPWLADQFTYIECAVDCSAKLQRLLELMEEIVSAGDKVLIFTSYQKSVDLLVHELASRFGIPTAPIDGRTLPEERQPIVDRFASLTHPAALVLNPRAAGTGLNITAANHVIHFNLEWNPAIEDQATARAHRRGQERAVTVHRLFYVSTVEDVINERMERKRMLGSAAVVGVTGEDADVQDILRALRMSPIHGHLGET